MNVLLRAIYSVNMADNVGEALEAVMEAASKLGIKVPESVESREDVLSFLKNRGINGGIYSPEA